MAVVDTDLSVKPGSGAVWVVDTALLVKPGSGAVSSVGLVVRAVLGAVVV